MPERVRHQRRRRREHHVRRHRGADEEVDLARLDAGVRQRLARGGQRDVGQRLVLGGHPPLADPRPLDDPLVGRVDVLREVVVRDDALGDVDAEAGDPDPRPVRRADHEPWGTGVPQSRDPTRPASRSPHGALEPRQRSTANVSVPRAASSPPTCAVALPRPIGPRTWSISQASVSVSPGRDDPLEAAVVDPGEERDLAAVLLLDEHGDRAGLRHRLDDEHARHHGPLREVPANHQPSSGTRYDAATRVPGLELEHLVEEEERVAVRQDRRDHVAPERGGGSHRRVYWGCARLPVVSAAATDSFPAASRAVTTSVRAARCAGSARSRPPSTRSTRARR